jgi:hypothetical protein
MPTLYAEGGVLADPLRQVGLCLHRTGAQRSRRLEQEVVFMARIRVGHGACQNDEIDQVHRFIQRPVV